MPKFPNTDKVEAGAEVPTPNLLEILSQNRKLLPVREDWESKKATWPTLPDPAIPVEVSALQTTLPDVSVVNLPPPPNPAQLYEDSCKADPTIKLLPIPTLPDKSEYPLTLSPDIK